MSVNKILAPARRGVKEHSSLILSVGAGIGVIATAYLAAQAGYRTAQTLSHEDPNEDIREKAKRVWRFYIPAGATGAATIICIASVKRIDGRKTLAAQTALAIAQQSYLEYREKVIEEFGEKKDQAIVAKVAEKKIENSPPGTIVVSDGSVLCCELWTGRYFESNMQELQRAVNEVNSMMLRHDYATLWDLYYIIGLEATHVSSQAGWSSDKLLELDYSSILHKGQPVLAFDYNYVKSF